MCIFRQKRHIRFRPVNHRDDRICGGNPMRPRRERANYDIWDAIIQEIELCEQRNFPAYPA
jgi:hypothetical protein